MRFLGRTCVRVVESVAVCARRSGRCRAGARRQRPRRERRGGDPGPRWTRRARASTARTPHRRTRAAPASWASRHYDVGVEAISNYGIGLNAVSSSGVALDVSGVASFSRSGRATVPAGASKVVVPGVKLGDQSMVLAFVQQLGAPAVKGAIPDAASGSITIALAKAAATNMVVAWFVLN